ncbi:MAG: hypothetical protein IM600_16820 [Bacteroidetes bacterium]|nr:hypothetical protein [Bacteroidota bacterium]MCA6445094.1 hypothetical protein [Bacteroidota bacterium]
MEEKTKINTQNPESITYTTEELSFTILGGIKLEGLDRLRVTLKIEVANRKFKHYLNNPDIADLALRQNLDLYNDIQVEKLIRRTAERLEVGSTAIAKAIADITNQLEVYRLQQIERSATASNNKKIILTEDEITEAKEFLSETNLIQRTTVYIGKSGVIGEELNRILMYIIFTSRKLSHPLHIVSLGSSGTGKTHLQEKVSELIPDEDKLEITTLSENAFYYFGQRELSHKLILIEDLDGAINVLFPLRELQSKKRISKTVTFKDTRGITKTITLTVEGPVSVAGCTTKERIYEDNANRSFLIYLDESSEQDNKIMQYQRELAAGLINTDEQEKIKQLLQNTQRVLQNIKIVNPYATQLQLPKEVFKPRRTNKHYLDFIEAITFYHQYQRRWIDINTGEIIYDPQVERSEIPIGAIAKHREEIYIETTIEDIEEANKLMKEILLRKADELSGACRNYFEQLKQWLQTESKSSFTNYEARMALRENHSNQKRYMLQLQLGHFVKQIKQKEKSKTHHYEIVSAEEYKQLKNRIGTVLDEILQQLKTRCPEPVEGVHQSKPVQNKNELTNTSKIKRNKKSSKSSQKDNEDLKNNDTQETEAAE